MEIPSLHSWDLTPTAAVALQKELAGRIDTRSPLAGCELVAGADVSYNRFSPVFYAAVVVVRVSDGAIVETQSAVRESPFPYVPGLLSFREGPVLLEVFAKLKTRPDAVMFDAAGYAHPRRFGLPATSASVSTFRAWDVPRAFWLARRAHREKSLVRLLPSRTVRKSLAARSAPSTASSRCMFPSDIRSTWQVLCA